LPNAAYVSGGQLSVAGAAVQPAGYLTEKPFRVETKVRLSDGIATGEAMGSWLVAGLAGTLGLALEVGLGTGLGVRSGVAETAGPTTLD
jgi:hypothetical protein